MDLKNIFLNFQNRQDIWNKVFSGKNGEYVLLQLFEYCKFAGSSSTDDLKIIEGRRQVYNFIMKCMKQDLDSIRKSYEKKITKGV